MEKIWLENIDINIYLFKIILIGIVTYIIDKKLMNTKIVKKKIPIIVLEFFIIGIIATVIRSFMNLFSSMVFLVCLNSIIYMKYNKIKLGYSIILNIISLGTNYVLFFMASIIAFIPYLILNLQNEYVNFICIVIIYIVIVILFLKTKRLKNGVKFLKNNQDSEIFNLVYLNISMTILLIIILLSNYEISTARIIIPMLIIFSILMFITIQKSLQLYYKHKMLVKALEETQKDLNEKKEEVKKLEEENLNFSQTSHSISHRQKSIEHKLNILLANNGNINSKDIENEIKNIRKELEIETKVKLKKTGIAVIDDMLSYMQAECIKNNINFQLQISGNMYHMVNNYIDKSDLEILLADHIKDAIIAVNHVETNNKSILVRIGEIDGKYGVYFYDSGVEFTIDTLIKLGKVPVTTYKGEGGSGMGFMNSFNTLNKYKATLIIEELNKPTNDNFTKVLKFIFNEEEKFKILSYRNQEIANKNNNKELIIEKLQK